METYDVKRHHRALYAPRRGVLGLVEVPTTSFVAVDGHGDPNTEPAYGRAVAALYAVSYAARAVARRELGRVHVVAPLEGLWSAADMTAFRERDKSSWDWTLMVSQPPWVTSEIVAQATAEARRRGKVPVDAVREETLTEGLCVQVLHVGPYDDEGPVLERLHEEFVPEHDLELRGRHHEIYLSDPRRTEPSRLRTILRQPVTRRSGSAAPTA